MNSASAAVHKHAPCSLMFGFNLSRHTGEIGFFDFYIIPLAKKLKECGVFGVSSDEYLNYAIQNRDEWEACGEKVVADMVEKVNRVWTEIEATGENEKSTMERLLSTM